MVSSCSLTFCKIAILLIFSKFKGKQLRWSHFLVKFAYLLSTFTEELMELRIPSLSVQHL